MQSYINSNVLALINLALDEDINKFSGVSTGDTIDITSHACIPYDIVSEANVVTKEVGIIFGQEVALEICKIVDPNIIYKLIVPDGGNAEKNTVIASLTGPMRSILTAERVILNFLQRLSAVATSTFYATKIASRYNVKVLDTRKTTPGFRTLEKAAVRAGGGTNHRNGLYDEFLIKNNHVDALDGDISAAIKLCRTFRPRLKLKVEVRNRQEINSALAESPDGLLLDNFTPMDLKNEVEMIRSNKSFQSITLEASGGITMENLEQYAKTGVNEVSLGFLTHSSQALDISLRFQKNK